MTGSDRLLQINPEADPFGPVPDDPFHPVNLLKGLPPNALLVQAVRHDDPRWVRFALDRGAHPLRAKWDGVDVLHAAAMHGCPESIKVILDDRPHMRQNRELLHWMWSVSATCRDRVICEILCQRGFRPTIIDRAMVELARVWLRITHPSIPPPPPRDEAYYARLRERGMKQPE